MYAAPNLYGTRDYLHPVDAVFQEMCREECLFKEYPCDKDVFALCLDLLAETNLHIPNDVYESVNMYVLLREAILNVLN